MVSGTTYAKCGGTRTVTVSTCAYCDSTLNKKNAFKCSYCERAICGDCLVTCCDCGDTLCPKCAITCKWCDNDYCRNCLKECYQCGDEGCKYCYTACANCGRYYHCPDCASDCMIQCDLCEEWFCDSCIDEHDCDGIGEKEPDYSFIEGDDGHGYHYGLEIEVFGSHDHVTIKDSPLIAGWGSDSSLSYPGAGEYQTVPLPWSHAVLEKLTDLVRGIDPVNGDENEAGGHVHVDRTPRQTALGWQIALEAISPEQASELNMRQFDDTRNEYCSLYDYSFEGKHCAVNDDHLSTIELRVFGPWWRGTVSELVPAMEWTHEMWEWFEFHVNAGEPEIEDESRAIASIVLAK